MTLILSGTDGLSDVDGSAATPAIRGTDANTGIFFPAADTIGFAEGGAEVMRIDSSGNVGIGTSSPDLKLSVAGGMNLRNSSRAGAFEIDSSGNLWSGTATTAGNIYFETGHSTTGLPSTGTARVTVNQYGLGLGATPSSGTGITFPATQSASSDANTLDDYEEGTFTPSLGGNTTYAVQQGSYTKVGRMVYLNFDISVTTLGTGSAATFSGMPFASGTGTSNAGAVAFFTGIATSSYSLFIRNDAATASTNIYSQNTQSTVMGTASVFGNGARVIGSITYQV